MKIKKKQLSFEEAVKATPEIKDCFKISLKALERDHTSKIKFADKNKLCGSVFLDQCLTDQNLSPGNRWDYIICYDQELYFVEVHGAYPKEVDVVIRKKEWLKLWLREKAPEISKLQVKNKSAFHWIQSDRFDFQTPKTNPWLKRAAENGIKPKKSLELK